MFDISLFLKISEDKNNLCFLGKLTIYQMNIKRNMQGVTFNQRTKTIRLLTQFFGFGTLGYP